MFGTPIFRKGALDKMMTPDDLDELLQVNSPARWLLFAGLCVVLAGLLVWVFFGSISMQVRGFGIIKTRELPRDVISEEPGQVDSVFCRTGDEVEAGEKLVKILTAGGQKGLYICSAFPGQITGLNVREGSYIHAGTPLLGLMRRETPGQTAPEVIFFVSEEDVALLKKGMVSSLGIDKEGLPDQFLYAKINFIAGYHVSKAAIQNYFRDKDMSEQIGNREFHEVRGDLVPGGSGQPPLTKETLRALNGLSCRTVTIVDHRSPITFFIY